MTDPAANRRQAESEIAHWRQAIADLADVDALSSAAAWAGLEEYLRMGLRTRLRSVVASLELEGAQLQVAFRAGAATAELRERLLSLRGRYVQAETVLDFFGDAVATRSDPGTAALLRGLDMIAADSMDLVLRPLGIEAPPVLVYLDKGLGASILKAGVRLWDRANPSPAAAIKVTRHNLGHPTALLHETGHQVAHLTGWNQELAATLASRLRGRSTELANAWEGWASEVGADVYAFALAGWAPLPALANVVDGSTEAVFRVIPGDPHCTADPTGRSIYQETLLDSGTLRQLGSPSNYEGTSMAVPHVTATAALVVATKAIGANPTPSQLEDHLKTTARDLGTVGYDQNYGWGLVDAAAATATPATSSG